LAIPNRFPGIGASGFTNVRILVPIPVVTIGEFSHGAGIILAILSVAKNLCRSQMDPSLGSGVTDTVYSSN